MKRRERMKGRQRKRWVRVKVSMQMEEKLNKELDKDAK